MFIPQRFVTLHLTRLCNSHCTFCTTDPMGRSNDTAKLEEIEAFLADNAGKGYEAVTVIGGEPTLYKGLPRVIEMIYEYGYPMVQMFTNGRTLRNYRYAEKLAGMGVSLYYISFHGADAKTHDDLTERPGSWAQALEGIRNVKKLGQDVQSMTVVNRNNYTQLRAICEVLMDAGVDVIDISGLCPGGLAILNWEDLVAPYAEIYPHLEEAIAFCRDADQEIVLEGFPFCAVRPFEEMCVEYPDTRKERMLFHGHLIQDYDNALNSAHKVRVPQCESCAVSHICGGVYNRYVSSFGTDHYQSIPSYHPPKAPTESSAMRVATG